jgi:hypothetical protein
MAHSDHDRSDARQLEAQAPPGLRLVHLAMAADVYRTKQEVMTYFDNHRVICGGQKANSTLLECPDIPPNRHNAVRRIVRNRRKYKKVAHAHGLQAAVHAFSTKFLWTPMTGRGGSYGSGTFHRLYAAATCSPIWVCPYLWQCS